MKNSPSLDDHPEPSFLGRVVKNLWRKYAKSEPDGTLRETIEELIEDSEESEPSIESDERELLGNVLNLRDLTASDVMVPRSDIVASPDTATLPELISQFVKTGVNRIVIFKENLDHVVGMVSVNDILAWTQTKKAFKIKTILKDVLFVSPTMRTLDLLLQMRETGSKLAVIVDEYGGVDGIVTFSNLIEEVIGDIQDAHDMGTSHQVELKPDGTIVADARVRLDELEETLQVKFPFISPDEEVDTLGGLVFFLAGRIPIRGEIITHPSGIEFEIIDADLRRLKRIKIHKISLLSGKLL
jgi:magnesium and cobalt transporter